MKNQNVKNQRHVIKKTLIEFTLYDKNKAQHYFDQASRLVKEQLTPELDKLLSKNLPGDQPHYIDRLEIDLGKIKTKEIDSTFTEQCLKLINNNSVFKQAVARATAENRKRDQEQFKEYTSADNGAEANEFATSAILRKANDTDPDNKKDAKRKKRHHSPIETLDYFARYASLPWWADEKRATILNDCLKKAIEQHPEQLVLAVSKWHNNRKQLDRIIYSFNDSELLSIVQLFLSDSQYKTLTTRGTKSLAIIKEHAAFNPSIFSDTEFKHKYSGTNPFYLYFWHSIFTGVINLNLSAYERASKLKTVNIAPPQSLAELIALTFIEELKSVAVNPAALGVALMGEKLTFHSIHDHNQANLQNTREPKTKARELNALLQIIKTLYPEYDQHILSDHPLGSDDERNFTTKNNEKEKGKKTEIINRKLDEYDHFWLEVIKNIIAIGQTSEQHSYLKNFSNFLIHLDNSQQTVAKALLSGRPIDYVVEILIQEKIRAFGQDIVATHGIALSNTNNMPDGSDQETANSIRRHELSSSNNKPSALNEPKESDNAMEALYTRKQKALYLNKLKALDKAAFKEGVTRYWRYIEQETQNNFSAKSLASRKNQKREESKTEVTSSFLDSDGYYIANSGLILLWPFFTNFFKRLGFFSHIPDGNKHNFANDIDRALAVNILQSIVNPELYLEKNRYQTNEQGNGEYWLPLNKVLCGMDIDDPINQNIILPDAQIDETETLLSAVISHAQVLKSMSPMHFRHLFLQRNGILSQRDGTWLLQVEHENQDALISQFSWTIQWIKLDWMHLPIRVEWNTQ